MIRLRLAALALVPLLACSSHVVPINITVITKTCGGAPSPTQDVDHYKAVVTAPDLDSPIVSTFAVGAGAQLDQIPPGDNRVITLTGYQGDPNNGGTPKAFGQTMPFGVPDNPDSPVNATIVLRAVGTFAGVPTVADPGTCAKLTIPRAGHTATLLNDGRVLIAGGFSLRDGGSTAFNTASVPANWAFHDEAEIFDPATNMSTPVHAMQAVDRSYGHYIAFHAASLLSDGTVLVTGGEQWSGDSFDARPDWIRYDPSSDSWNDDYMEAPEFIYPDGGEERIARSHHIQFTDNAGNVIITGGVSYESPGSGAPRVAQLVSKSFWINPAGQFHGIVQDGGAPIVVSRVNAGSAGVIGNTALAIGGGDVLDGGLASPPFWFFNFDPDTGVVDSPGYLDENADDPPRTRAAIAAVGADQRFIVMAGGLDQNGNLLGFTTMVDSTDSTGHQQIPVGVSRGRTDACAVTLPDGRAVVIGGETPGSPPTTQALADIYATQQQQNGSLVGVSNPTGQLTTSRKWQTCTVLKDGSVLVTGGVNESGGKFQVLDSIELYTPVPL